jgi:hypothetical protein
MVLLPPDPAINPLCLNEACYRHKKCARYMTHWQKGASTFRPAGGDGCEYFMPIPSRPKAEDLLDDNVLQFRTRSGRVLDRSGE